MQVHEGVGSLKLKFIGRVGKPQQDAVSEAVALINEQRDKWNESKEKWLKFAIPDAADAPFSKEEAVSFLKAVRSRLATDHRRRYGSSRFLTVILDPLDEALYVEHVNY